MYRIKINKQVQDEINLCFGGSRELRGNILGICLRSTLRLRMFTQSRSQKIFSMAFVIFASKSTMIDTVGLRVFRWHSGIMRIFIYSGAIT